MIAATFTAAIPKPFRILGLKLKPLSLGRYRILRWFNCAFVSEESTVALPGDLILGVLACSMRCDEFAELVNEGKLYRAAERWGNKVFRTGPWRKYIPNRFQKPRDFNYLEKVQLFKRYLSEGWEVPKYWIEEQSEQSGAHWSQSMEVILRGELGWTLEEINEQPIGKAISDYYKWLENKGAIRLMSDYEVQMIADLEGARN